MTLTAHSIPCQAFLKMSRKKHFISPIFRGLKEGKSKAKSKNAFYRSSFNVSLLCTCQQKLDTKLKKLGIKIEYLYKIQ